jgi:hypothetical protein
VSAQAQEHDPAELRRKPFGPADPGFADFELGARALVDALRLSEARASAASALILLRTAVLALARARRARAPEPAGMPPPVDDWLGLLQLPDLAPLLEALPPEHAAQLQQLLAPNFDAARLPALPERERERCLITLRRIAFALGDPLENDASALRRARTARRARRAALACVGLLALGWGLARALHRPNLALHKPVVVDRPDPQLVVDPAHVVDGDRTNLGFHTVARGNKSVLIDLLTPQRIRRVDVYNRMDCCQERVVPLSIDVSNDGKTFLHVANRNHRFALWKASFPPVEARWVRLTQSNDQPFHLSEIEVY